MGGHRFDVIVVGTGFGGSVAGARLAEKGMRVLLLERGPWWGPLQRQRPERDRREWPRGAWGLRKMVRSLRSARKGRRSERLFHADGLLEFHRFDHLNTLTGSGVGGGSHIYTNILEAPSPDFIDTFPEPLRGDALRPWFDQVRAMLRPAPLPAPTETQRTFAEALDAAGLPPPDYPPLAIAWGDDPSHPKQITNAAGVEQRTSTFKGDAFVGSEDGSKTTLDLTYVPLALHHGAELRPLCEVLAVGGEEGGYWVRYRDHRSGEVRREEAPRLILAAGGLNTQRLLFDARDGHGGLPRLPSTLGQRFSPHADFVALLWRSRLLEDTAYGPSVGALTRVSGGNGNLRFALGQLGLPVHAVPGPATLRHALRRSLMLFSMGRDAGTGRIGFDGTGLVTSLDRSFDSVIYDEIEAAMKNVAEHMQPTRLLLNILSGRGENGLFTVHPLGGCAIGADAETGFTDHRGQVFGHPGLFVADGSLYPRPPGCAPSLTIAALAERQAAMMD